MDDKESLEALYEGGEQRYFRSARRPLRNVTYIRVVNVVHTRHKQRVGHEHRCLKRKLWVFAFLFIHHQRMDFIRDHYTAHEGACGTRRTPQGDSRWSFLMNI